MDYVVLARKLRPSRFKDLIGQDTVVRSLLNAVVSGRTAHAYLFAGSRGVGKTSAARILTKAINCLAPQEGEPCNACDNCREIASNASPDVLEIDAASNRGIDSIRELRDNTKYTPAKCTYKTYIIDEVHMLTMESFNALLKTLEEPPPHVKFILATTAAHRLPETILSRCQRYDFPRIPLGLMQEYLARVTADEGITLSPATLEIIARNAAGGMRDALTAVDQVVAFAGNSPTDDEVLNILGVMDTREVLSLLGALLDKGLGQALEIFAAIVERGHDLETLLEALLKEVKDFSLHKSLGGQSSYFQDHPPTTLEFYDSRKEGVTLDELQQIFYLLLELENQLRLSEHNRACFEMALVKACRVEPLVGVPELLAQVRGIMGSAPTAPPTTEHRPASAAKPRERQGGGSRPGASTASATTEQDGEADGASAAAPTHAANATHSVPTSPVPTGPAPTGSVPTAPVPAAPPVTAPAPSEVASGPASVPTASVPMSPPATAPDPAPSPADDAGSPGAAPPTGPPTESPSEPLSEAAPATAAPAENTGAGHPHDNPPPPPNRAAPEDSGDMPEGTVTMPEGNMTVPDGTMTEQADFSEEMPATEAGNPPDHQAVSRAPEAEAAPEAKGAPEAEAAPAANSAPAEEGAVPEPVSQSSPQSPEAPAAEGAPEANGAPADDQAAQDAAPLDRPIPCEDARWLALVEAVRVNRRKLAADLRRAEVAAIGESEIEIVLPSAGMEIGAPELEFLRGPLSEAFGAAFHLRIDHDSNRKSRHAYSLIGREEQIEQSRLTAERDAAIADDKVQRIMRAFPKGKVEHVDHPQATRNRRNDV